MSQVREQGAVVGRGRASWEGSGGGGEDEKGGSGVRRSRNGGRDGSESYARLSSFSPALISFDGWFSKFDSIPAPEKCLTSFWKA